MGRIKKLLVTAGCALVALTSAPSQARAAMIVGQGCIYWTAGLGCLEYQVCAYDTVVKDMACCVYSAAGENCTYYPFVAEPLIASNDPLRSRLPSGRNEDGAVKAAQMLLPGLDPPRVRA